MKKTAVCLALFALAASARCAAPSLSNPLSGDKYTADPCIVWDDVTQYYYLLCTHSKEVQIRRSKTLVGIRETKPFTAYRSSAKDGIHGNIWAPEMHKAPNGKWYVYTSGSVAPGNPWGRKRLFVIESKTHDPFDGFVFKGSPDPDLFAIDPTVLTLSSGRQYICYSKVVHEKNASQVLVFRELVNPWTFGPREIEIARPKFKWELVQGNINEGAFFIRSPDDKRVFCVYSGNGCFCDDYALGVVEFTGGDFFSAGNWKKHPEPILFKGNGMFGPGHASFFRSPDATELWCAYHALGKSNPSCKPVHRMLCVQKVGFTAEGYPVMGKAVGKAVQKLPAGTCAAK